MTPRDGPSPGFLPDASAPADEDIGHSPGASPYDQVLSWLRRQAGLSANAETAAARTKGLNNEPLPLALNRLGAVSDADLQAAFLAVSGLPAAEGEPDASIVEQFSAAFMRAHRCIVLKHDGEALRLGLVDPFDDEAIRGARF